MRRVDRVSKAKLRHTIPIRHRDEVEAPVTDWLAEAYALSGAPAAKESVPPAAAREPEAGASPPPHDTRG